MHHVYRALRRLVESVPDTEVVFPVHRNPLVREAVSEELEGVPGIHLVDPMEYEPFTNLMARAAIVLTDSGGIQEEAPSFGKPVLVLRDTTERPEAVEASTVRLVGTDEEKVFQTAYKLLTDEKEYKSNGKPSIHMATANLQHASLIIYFGRKESATKTYEIYSQ